MAVKGAGIEVDSLSSIGQHRDRFDQRDLIMGRTGKSKNSELPKTKVAKPKKPPPAPSEDDDYEDGDIATPKRDRHGDDDQPL
jgi:hypothetical protein